MFVLIAIKGARMVVQYLTMHHEIPHSPYCTDIIYRRAIGDDTCLHLFCISTIASRLNELMNYFRKKKWLNVFIVHKEERHTYDNKCMAPFCH